MKDYYEDEVYFIEVIYDDKVKSGIQRSFPVKKY